MRKGFVVLGRKVEKLRIWSQVEGLLSKAVKGFIHRKFSLGSPETTLVPRVDCNTNPRLTKVESGTAGINLSVQEFTSTLSWSV